MIQHQLSKHTPSGKTRMGEEGGERRSRGEGEVRRERGERREERGAVR